MDHALGSNRAEYSRRRELQLHIALTLSMMNQPPLNTKNKSLPELRRIWHAVYIEAKAAGVIK